VKSFFKSIPLSIQHVFAMFGATVLVPILTGLSPGATLIASGVGTLIFHLITRGKVPAYLGSSFAFIAPLALFVSKNHSPSQAVTGLISVSIVYGIFSLIISTVGFANVRKAIPSVVVGPVVAIIGLSLAQVAVQTEASTHWDVAIVSLLAAIIAAIAGTKQMRIIPILVGIVVGYVYAVIRGLVQFAPVHTASWLQLPQFHVPTFSWQVVLAMAPIALVTMVEDLGHMFVLNEITGRDVTKNPGFGSILLGNGVATLFSAFIGGPAETTYAENLGVLAMTRQFSSRIIQGAAVVAIILGLLGKFGALIQSIPAAVMGGIGILLYGMIAAMGIRHMVEEKVDLANTKNLIIVAVIFIVGIGAKSGGIAIATLAGLVIYWLVPDLSRRTAK